MCGAAVVLALVLLYRPITPRITFNDGLGYDGQSYAQMVRVFRGEAVSAPLAERPNYAYRPLPPAIVAATPFDVIRGFYWMNVVSVVLAGGFLALTVARAVPGVWLPLLAVLWWGALAGSVRYAMYYPVLVDGIGLLLLFALVYAIVARIPWLFVVLIAPAMIARENLIVLVPMLGLALLPLGLRRASAWTVLAGVVALAAYAWVRIAPPIPAAETFDAVHEARQNVEWLFTNTNDRALRFASAWLLAIGLFALVPLVRLRTTLTFLRTELAWAYYLVSTLALIIVIGGDYDRYFLYLVPVLAVLTARALSGVRPIVIAIVTVAHLLVARFAWPVSSTEDAYLGYNVATMDVPLLQTLFAAAAAVALGAAIVLYFASERKNWRAAAGSMVLP